MGEPSAMGSDARTYMAGVEARSRPYVSAAPQLDRDALDRGRAIVRGQRHLDYGPPERNLAAIAQVWSALFPDKAGGYTARDVALMLAALKLVRATSRINDDDLPDLAGYVLLAEEATESV